MIQINHVFFVSSIICININIRIRVPGITLILFNERINWYVTI